MSFYSPKQICLKLVAFPFLLSYFFLCIFPLSTPHVALSQSSPSPESAGSNDITRDQTETIERKRETLREKLEKEIDDTCRTTSVYRETSESLLFSAGSSSDFEKAMHLSLLIPLSRESSDKSVDSCLSQLHNFVSRRSQGFQFIPSVDNGDVQEQLISYLGNFPSAKQGIPSGKQGRGIPWPNIRLFLVVVLAFFLVLAFSLAMIAIHMSQSRATRSMPRNLGNDAIDVPSQGHENGSGQLKSIVNKQDEMLKKQDENREIILQKIGDVIQILQGPFPQKFNDSVQRATVGGAWPNKRPSHADIESVYNNIMNTYEKDTDRQRELQQSFRDVLIKVSLKNPDQVQAGEKAKFERDDNGVFWVVRDQENQLLMFPSPNISLVANNNKGALSAFDLDGDGRHVRHLHRAATMESKDGLHYLVKHKGSIQVT